jgi:DNA (cytosine-5)-methyltransferase 1
MVNKQCTNEGLRELALFAGAGGGILGGHLLGWRTVCAVEWEPYAASILAARQNDGVLPPFPIWDDVQTFDGRPWRGIVDVISGGFPCQDISAAGKGAGIDGERSGLWKHMARIIGEVRPQYAFVENSPLLVKRGLAVVISDLAEMGYDCQWCIVSASDCGAPHKRDRLWLVANSTQLQRNGSNNNAGVGVGSESFPESRDDGWAGYVADANEIRPQRQWAADGALGWKTSRRPVGLCNGAHTGRATDWWASEPNVGRVADGVAARVDRLKAIGNGQVPAVAATAFRVLN